MKRFIWAIVVLALVLFLLIVIVLPSISVSRPNLSILRSQTQVRSLVQGAIVYAGNHNYELPTKEQWPDALIELGIIEPDLLVSRAEDGDGVSFIYVPGPNLFDEAQILVYEDSKHWEQGVIVGFADASVEIIPHDEFDRMLAEQLASQVTEP